MLRIVTAPHPILIQTARPVTKFDKKLHAKIQEMKRALEKTTDPVGVGLAAPQVALPLRLFLMRPEEKGPISVFINPQVESTSAQKGIPRLSTSKKVEARKPKKSRKKLLEGCLSIPNIWGNVTRAKSVTLAFQDEQGKQHKKTFTGFSTVIIQHEIDHLEGILFTKHVMDQGEKLYRSYKNEKGEDEFEEVKI